jgi:hypothetical protein
MNDVKDKIAKLMAMANDGRGNAFEAEAALRLAQKLMTKHNIDIAEICARDNTKPVYNWQTVAVPAGAPKPVDKAVGWFGALCVGIAKFTDTAAAWKRVDGHGMCITFSGDAVDVEYAVWLAKHLRDNVRSQSATFPGTRSDKENFRVAMVVRVSERLRILSAERETELRAAPTGSAMVLVTNKIALRNQHFGGAARYGTTRRGCDNQHAHASGRAAGDRVGIGRPMQGSNHAGMLT